MQEPTTLTVRHPMELSKLHAERSLAIDNSFREVETLSLEHASRGLNGAQAMLAAVKELLVSTRIEGNNYRREQALAKIEACLEAGLQFEAAGLQFESFKSEVATIAPVVAEKLSMLFASPSKPDKDMDKKYLLH